MLRDMAERARRLAAFIGRDDDRDALLDLARDCDLRLARLLAGGTERRAA